LRLREDQLKQKESELKQKEEELWHILYSVEDKIEIEKALKSFASKNSLSEDFADIFKKIKPFEKDYGAYSEKALKKLLPLMRISLVALQHAF
jgi:CRISPR-associated endonuclease Csn1